MSLLNRFLTGAITVLSSVMTLCAASNVAYQDNSVRFTIVTDGMVRLEWSPSGSFVDDPSFVAINRDYPAVDYKVSQKGGKVVITTDKMVITYKLKSGAFSSSNLSIVSAKGLKPAFKWHPGLKQEDNLGGTFRTLDGMDGDMQESGIQVEMPDGLLSKDGWTLIDDSRNFLFDDSDWNWVKAREGKDGQDWYFMAYGHDYKQALKDFSILAGTIPMPPRYAFGYWWSRYYAYTDNELRKLISNFNQYDIPLDVLVIDMDWHHTDAGRGGWTGYTWNERLFPDYRKFLEYIHDNGLKVTLNLHPAEGVHSYEVQYPDIANDMGVDPQSGKTIEWVGSDKKFMTSMFNNVFHPFEKDGVDFWWLDWQQFPYDQRVDSLSNTWWINYCFFSDKERNSQVRPMLYHRWGGLGNHRYQIGFSGDSKITWNSLEYQPYFNNTASNVLYGYWSHDIGGHMQGDIIPEMYIRWMQFGALSPILRTHSTKDARLNKEPWVFNSDDMETIVGIIRQRYQMAPYIYTMARDAYETAVSLCRPMYYDYPDNTEAYDKKNQYMFGDQIMVAPITAPMAEDDVYSAQDVWLPEGNDWYELHTGTLLNGGQSVERYFLLEEYPIYIKAGSILPMYYDNPSNLSSNDEPVEVVVYPGAQSGEFSMYEDAGNSKDYDKNFARTAFSYIRNGKELTVDIAPRVGSYEDMPMTRKYRVRIEGSVDPVSVTVDGKPAKFDYDGKTLSVIVDLGEVAADKGAKVVVVYPQQSENGYLDYTIADGTKGRIAHGVKAISDLNSVNPAIVLSDDMGIIETTGIGLTYNPKDVKARLDRFNQAYSHLPQILEQMKVKGQQAQDFLNITRY